MLGIMPRHACSARCGARRRSGTWRFRSAPCLPIRQVVNAPIVRSIHLVTAAAHADLWICGQRKRVAHIPTGSKNKSKRQFDCFGSTALKPGPSQPRPSARAAATPVAAFGVYPGRHSQLKLHYDDKCARTSGLSRRANRRHCHGNARNCQSNNAQSVYQTTMLHNSRRQIPESNESYSRSVTSLR